VGWQPRIRGRLGAGAGWQSETLALPNRNKVAWPGPCGGLQHPSPPRRQRRRSTLRPHRGAPPAPLIRMACLPCADEAGLATLAPSLRPPSFRQGAHFCQTGHVRFQRGGIPAGRPGQRAWPLWATSRPGGSLRADPDPPIGWHCAASSRRSSPKGGCAGRLGHRQAGVDGRPAGCCGARLARFHREGPGPPPAHPGP